MTAERLSLSAMDRVLRLTMPTNANVARWVRPWVLILGFTMSAACGKTRTVFCPWFQLWMIRIRTAYIYMQGRRKDSICSTRFGQKLRKRLVRKRSLLGVGYTNGTGLSGTIN